MAKQKNILKCEKKVMISVEYHDLEKFIQDELNLPEYDFIADEELNNDTTWTAKVEPIEMNSKELCDIVRGKETTMYKTRNLLDQLCFEGLLEAGEYAVDICW